MEAFLEKDEIRISRKWLQGEIASPGLNEDLYNVCLFHYVYRFQRDLLTKSCLTGCFGKSVLLASVKYDQKILAFFQIILTIFDVRELIPKIPQAIDFAASRIYFLRCRKENFGQDMRVGILFRMGSMGLFFLQKLDLFYYIEFDGYIACLKKSG